MKPSLTWAHYSILVVMYACSSTSVSGAEQIIEATSAIKWKPNTSSAKVGDVVDWKMSASNPGKHGVRITNWSAVKDLVEVETVADQQEFDAATGENGTSTTTASKVLLRLKIKSVTEATPKIAYECIVHGSLMKGEVALGQ